MGMLHHISFGLSNIEYSASFYDAAHVPLAQADGPSQILTPGCSKMAAPAFDRPMIPSITQPSSSIPIEAIFNSPE
jgi:hypothetical protein